MEFWNHKVNVSKEAAEQQIKIVNTFSSEKRIKIALNFADLGIQQTRDWIRRNNPSYSELEVNLEFVRLMYYETGKMSEESWKHFEDQMDLRIKKDWSNRFRKMMKENNWSYDDIARMGNFKSGKVIESTISRGLPAFAKLSVVIYEQQRKVGSA